MDTLNQKIVSSFDKNQDRALVSGIYGFNATSGKWNYINENGSGALSVDVHGGSIGSGDVKARTDPSDPNTSVFLKANANNHLKTQLVAQDDTGTFRDVACDSEGKLKTEITAEIRAEGLAQESKQDTMIANQTNGTSKVQVTGNTEGDGSGTAKHLHLDGNGNVNSQIINTVSTNAFRTVIGDGATNSHALVDSDGHLQVDILSGGGGGILQAEDDTSASRNVRCNNSGHVKTQLIGNTVGDGSGTNKVVQVNDAGQLKTKLIAEDNTATRREVRCNTTGHLQTALLGNTAGDGSGTIKNVVTNTDGNLVVKADITNTSIATTTSKTTTAVSLYSGGSVTIGTSSTQDFTNGTVGSGTFAQLNVNGLGDVQYLVEGSGTTPSITIKELIGNTSSLGFVSQTQGFSDSEDFAVSLVDSKAQHRGLRIQNNSGSHTYTVSSITALYHA
jgi:hypothetical protein